MKATLIRIVPLILFVSIALGCSPAARQAETARTQAAESVGHTVPATPGAKRMTIAQPIELPSFYYGVIPPSVHTAGRIVELVNPGLTVFDNADVLHAVFVDAVPSTTNGLWQVASDGSMATTWHLKPGASWQDGAPMTSDDLRFTLRVMTDPALPVFGDKAYALIGGIETPDPATITVRWTRPYIQADWLFTYMLAQPLPQHLLAAPYAENKDGFLDLPYWSDQFVGTGPFKIKDWEHGTSVTLVANDRYLLGRPKLDQIEVRFINDTNTLVATVLSGQVDVAFQAVSIDQALLLKQQWQAGTVDIAPNGWLTVYPQFLNASPPLVTDLQFRKALMYGLDRKEMADTLMSGLTPPADSPLSPGTPEYDATKASIVSYPFAMQRATQMLGDLGYLKGGDGQLRDSTGQLLAFETRATEYREIQTKTLLSVVDGWKHLGLAVETNVIPAARAGDAQEQATFPAFQVLRQPNGPTRAISLISTQARLPERNYTGANNSRYMNAEMDALVDRYLATIPMDDRMEVLGKIVHHITDQLPVMGLFYDANTNLVSRRVEGISPNTGAEDVREAWNAYEWDVR